MFSGYFLPYLISFNILCKVTTQMFQNKSFLQNSEDLWRYKQMTQESWTLAVLFVR